VGRLCDCFLNDTATSLLGIVGNNPRRPADGLIDVELVKKCFGELCGDFFVLSIESVGVNLI